MSEIRNIIAEILDFHFDEYDTALSEIMLLLDKLFPKRPYCHDCGKYLSNVGMHSADHSISTKRGEA